MLGSGGSLMRNFDSFTIAVLAGAAIVILGFLLMLIMDKGKRATPPANPPAKVAGKR